MSVRLRHAEAGSFETPRPEVSGVQISASMLVF